MPDGMMQHKVPQLMCEPTLEPVVVVFHGEAEAGISFPLYRHTFPQRKTIEGVLEDIEEGYHQAVQHDRDFGCSAFVMQGSQHLLVVDTGPSTFVADDGWEPWQGAGGQRHESFRWAD